MPRIVLPAIQMELAKTLGITSQEELRVIQKVGHYETLSQMIMNDDHLMGVIDFHCRRISESKSLLPGVASVFEMGMTYGFYLGRFKAKHD